VTDQPSRFRVVFPVVVLVLGALAYAAFAVQWLAHPDAMARDLGITLTNGDATSDARAVYGGLELGLAAFLVYSALAPARRTQGLVALTLSLAGLGTCRLFGIAVAPGVSPATMQLLGTDLGGTALAAVALFVSRARRA
jgi:hypothetical protein